MTQRNGSTPTFPDWLTPEVMGFVCRRFIGEAGARGLSSDAMIAMALATADGLPCFYDGNYPHDTGDLARCCEAFHLAPPPLRERMLPILARWIADLETKRKEKEAARV